MDDHQAKNQQRIIAEVGEVSIALLREVAYCRKRVETLEEQVATLEARLAAIAANPGDFHAARGCLEELFEDDPRPSEQIVRDYRDSHDYLEPKPSDFNSMLDYFKARVEYHDRDESEEGNDGDR